MSDEPVELPVRDIAGSRHRHYVEVSDLDIDEMVERSELNRCFDVLVERVAKLEAKLKEMEAKP